MTSEDKTLDARLQKLPKQRLQSSDKTELWACIEAEIDERTSQAGVSTDKAIPGHQRLGSSTIEQRQAIRHGGSGRKTRRWKWHTMMSIAASVAAVIVVAGFAALVTHIGPFGNGSSTLGRTGKQPGTTPPGTTPPLNTSGNHMKNTTQNSVGNPFIVNPKAKILFQNASDFHMLNSNFGWIVDDNAAKNQHQMMITSDGGRTWHNVTPSYIRSHSDKVMTFGHMLGQFVSDQVGFVAVSTMSTDKSNYNATVFHPTVFATYNGGKNWSRLVLPGKASTYIPVAVNFISSQVGFVVTTSDNNGGEGGVDKRVYRTVDGGQHWTLMSDIGVGVGTTTPLQAGSVNPAQSFTWIRFVNQNLGFSEERLAGPATPNGTRNSTTNSTTRPGGTNLRLVRTTDGGRTWHPVPIGWVTYPSGAPTITKEQILPVQVLPDGHLVLDGLQTFAFRSQAHGTGSSTPGLNLSGKTRMSFYESTDKGQHFRLFFDAGNVNTTNVILQGGYFTNRSWWFWCAGNLMVTDYQKNSKSTSQSLGRTRPSMRILQGNQTQSDVTDVNPTTYMPDSRVSFINDRVGYLISSRGMWETTDQGNTWTALPTPSVH